MAAASREDLKEYVNSKGSIPRRISRSPRILIKFAQNFLAVLRLIPDIMGDEFDECVMCGDCSTSFMDWLKSRKKRGSK